MRKLEKLISQIDSLDREEIKRQLCELNDNIAGFWEMNLAVSNQPYAVDPALICTTEKSKLIRARNILRSMGFNYSKTTKFLDFGCGEGHFVKLLRDRVKLAVGYDPVKQWPDMPNMIINLNELVNYGQFDTILLCDVLDHVEKPISVLRAVGQLLTDDGLLYVRCHPWLSRHGGHHYRTYNKAFAHLMFSEKELEEEFDCQISKLQKSNQPSATYQKWFFTAGFVVKNSTIFSDELPRRMNEKIKKQIARNLGVKSCPEKVMQESLHNYILAKQ